MLSGLMSLQQKRILFYKRITSNATRRQNPSAVPVLITKSTTFSRIEIDEDDINYGAARADKICTRGYFINLTE